MSSRYSVSDRLALWRLVRKSLAPWPDFPMTHSERTFLREVGIAELEGRPHDLSSISVALTIGQSTVQRRVERMMGYDAIQVVRRGRRRVLVIHPSYREKYMHRVEDLIDEFIALADEIAGRT